MEAEFVNEYIARLNSTIHDLIGKNIMLETRLVMAERVSSNLSHELEQLKQSQAAASSSKGTK
jgi:hypothetical protein